MHPQVEEGEIIEPSVSVPIEKPTKPAAVADAGPADEPLDPVVLADDPEGRVARADERSHPLDDQLEGVLEIKHSRDGASRFVDCVERGGVEGLVGRDLRRSARCHPDERTSVTAVSGRPAPRNRLTGTSPGAGA